MIIELNPGEARGASSALQSQMDAPTLLHRSSLGRTGHSLSHQEVQIDQLPSEVLVSRSEPYTLEHAKGDDFDHGGIPQKPKIAEPFRVEVDIISTDRQLDPFQNELLRICNEQDMIVKMHDKMKTLLECAFESEKENLQKKYDMLLQDSAALFSDRKTSLELIYKKIILNKVLAENFCSGIYDNVVIEGTTTSSQGECSKVLLQKWMPSAPNITSSPTIIAPLPNASTSNSHGASSSIQVQATMAASNPTRPCTQIASSASSLTSSVTGVLFASHSDACVASSSIQLQNASVKRVMPACGTMSAPPAVTKPPNASLHDHQATPSSGQLQANIAPTSASRLAGLIQEVQFSSERRNISSVPPRNLKFVRSVARSPAPHLRNLSLPKSKTLLNASSSGGSLSSTPSTGYDKN